MSPSLPPLVLCKALWGSRWFRVRGACRGHYLSRGGQRGAPSLTANWMQLLEEFPNPNGLRDVYDYDMQPREIPRLVME